MVKIIVAVVLVSLSAALDPQINAFDPGSEKVMFMGRQLNLTNDREIAEHDRAIGERCASMAGVPFDGSWPGLDTDDQDRLERQLTALLFDKRKNERMPPRRYNLRSYFLQVCPIVSAGRKLVFMIGFHASIMPHRDRFRVQDSSWWRSNLIEPNHWKSRRFQATYDAASRTLSNFAFDE